MKPQEALQIHKELWSEETPETITYRENTYSVGVIKHLGADFKQVTLPNKLFLITQNMSKKSPNTDWVKGDPRRSLTWIFNDGTYVGKVVGQYIDGGFTYEVFTLSPEKRILIEKES